MHPQYQDWVFQFWVDDIADLCDDIVMDNPVAYQDMYPQDFPSLLGCVEE